MIALSRDIFQDIELGELGQTLPFGLVVDGRLLKEYTLLTYVGEHDLKLGSLEDASKEGPTRINRIYSKLLALMVETIGNYEIKEICHRLNDISPVQLFEQMYLADALSMVLNLRLVSYGSEVGINSYCPCPQQHLIKADDPGQSHHLLESIIIRKLSDNCLNAFPLTVELADGIEIDGQLIKIIEFEPPRFGHIPQLKDKALPRDIKLLYLCSVKPKFCDELYDQLSMDDIDILREATKLLERFGPNRDIEMDCQWSKCPYGSMEWKSRLVLGENYEDFYTSLMCAPRMKAEPGGTREYFDEIGFFWATGERAPAKSLDEVLGKTPISRENITKKLINYYEEINRQEKEAMSKSKSKSSSKY
jgi:hypothetical protein